MRQNKRLAINLTAQTINFAVNIGINFLLTPFIIKNIGSESYGFVGLANSFIIYAELITIALNSMAGRFIIIKIYQNDRENTNRYFTSVFCANLITAMTLIIPAFLIVINLNKIVHISSNITDVKLLWMFIFSNFIINIVFTTFGLATYSKDRFDLSSMLGITSSLIRVIVLTIAYRFFPANVWYLGLSTVLCTFYTLALNIYFTKRLLPEIKIQRKYFDFAAIKEIISSGIWNALTKLSQIFTSGVDLLITNIFISSIDMGVLALAKTVPNFIINFIVTISNVFNPQITKQYAKNDNVDLVHSVKNAMKLITVVSTIPNAFLLVFGVAFYKLWVPGEDAVRLQILSFLTVANLCITGPLQPLYQIFTITNKVKKNSIIMIIYGIVSVSFTLLLLKTTNLGVYCVVGVSILLSFIISLVFHIPYGAICLGLDWKTFYPEIGKSIVSFLMLSFFYFALKFVLPTDSWPRLFISLFICGCIGLLSNIFLLLSKRERKLLANQILKNFPEKRSMKKVLIMNDFIHGGGVEKLMKDLTTYLCDNEFHITILTPNYENEFYQLYDNSIHYLYINHSLSHKITLLTRIYNKVMGIINQTKIESYIKKSNYDIAIAFKEGPCMSFVAKLKVPKKLAWIHIDYNVLHWTKNYYKGKEELECMRRFNKVVCVSRTVMEGVRQKVGDPGNLCVVYNPLNKQDIMLKADELVSDITPPVDRLLFVTVGRLSKLKGYQRLLKVCYELNQLGHEYELWILGEGEDEVELKEYSEQRNLYNVKFLGYQANPYKYMKAADWFVCSSISESFGIALQEAIALGVPVITTYCPGACELIREERHGIIVDNSEEGIMKGMIKAFNNLELSADYKNKIGQENNIEMDSFQGILDLFETD